MISPLKTPVLSIPSEPFEKARTSALSRNFPRREGGAHFRPWERLSLELSCSKGNSQAHESCAWLFPFFVRLGVFPSFAGFSLKIPNIFSFRRRTDRRCHKRIRTSIPWECGLARRLYFPDFMRRGVNILPPLFKAGGKRLSAALAILTLAWTPPYAAPPAEAQPAVLPEEYAIRRTPPATSSLSPDKPGTSSGHTIPGYIQPSIAPSYLSRGRMPPPLARAVSVFPSAYDLRDQQDISPSVRNPAAWGTCWAFAAAGSAEPSLYPEHTTVFPPRRPAYFAYHGAANPHTPGDGTAGDPSRRWVFHRDGTSRYWHPWYACGGNPFLATATLARIGIPTVEAVPYPETYRYSGTETGSLGTPAPKEAYMEQYGDVSEAFPFTSPYRLVESNSLPARAAVGNLHGSAEQPLLGGLA